MELRLIPERIKYDPILGKTWYDVNYNDLNAFLIFVGKPGSRKSGSAGTVGFELDPSFSINRCVWLGSELLDLIEKGELINGKYQELKKGSVILWDETGVEGDNTEWYSQKAKVIKHVFTLSRYRNLIILMTTTSVGAVQIGVRRLLHGIFRMVGIPRDKEHFPSDKFAEAKFYWYHENFTDAKPRFTNPRYQYWKGDYSRLDHIYIPRPSEEWESAYKKRKDHYARNWVSLFRGELEKLNNRISVDSQIELKGVDYIAMAEKRLKENPKDFIISKPDGSYQFSYIFVMEKCPGISESKAKFVAKKYNTLVKVNRFSLEEGKVI